MRKLPCIPRSDVTGDTVLSSLSVLTLVRRELVQMLFLNRKAEIQILCGASSDPVQNVLEGLFGVQGEVMGDDDSGSQRRGEMGRNGLIEYVVQRLR